MYIIGFEHESKIRYYMTSNAAWRTQKGRLVNKVDIDFNIVVKKNLPRLTVTRRVLFTRRVYVTGDFIALIYGVRMRWIKITRTLHRPFYFFFVLRTNAMLYNRTVCARIYIHRYRLYVIHIVYGLRRLALTGFRVLYTHVSCCALQKRML